MESYSIPNFKDRMDYSIKKYDENNYELIVKKFNYRVFFRFLLMTSQNNKKMILN